MNTWHPQVTGVDFGVPAGGTIGERFPVWADAVKAARATIHPFRYQGHAVRTNSPDYHPRRHIQDGDTLVVYSRAFVQMRVTEPVQDHPGSAVRSGQDGVAMSWEVFADGTVEAR